jgi:UDP:flavonoid glycosyltransferase YjiC (YdhE family)
MTRIAITSQRLLGHIVPVMGVGIELKNRGHEVWVLGNAAYRPMVEGAGLLFREVGWEKFAELYIEEFMEDIIKVDQELDFQLFLCDSAQAAPAWVAEWKGIPWVSYQTTVPIPDNQVPGEELVNYRLRERYRKLLTKIRNKYGLGELLSDIRTRGDLSGLSPYLHLVMVWEEMIENWGALPPNSAVVGACTYENLDTESGWKTSEYANSIAVCTSSIGKTDFREKVNRYVRTSIEAFANNPVHVIVSEQNDFRGELPINVTWTTEYPIHHRILPFVDVAITHGGCNTLQKCIKYGTPMVIIPLGADQPLLAERCRQLGIAVTLDIKQLSVETLSQAVNKIMEHPDYRESSRKLSSAVNRYDPNKRGADAVEKIL